MLLNLSSVQGVEASPIDDLTTVTISFPILIHHRFSSYEFHWILLFENELPHLSSHWSFTSPGACLHGRLLFPGSPSFVTVRFFIYAWSFHSHVTGPLRTLGCTYPYVSLLQISLLSFWTYNSRQAIVPQFPRFWLLLAHFSFYIHHFIFHPRFVYVTCLFIWGIPLYTYSDLVLHKPQPFS